MSYTMLAVEKKLKQIVHMALRSDADDVVALGNIFQENVANFRNSDSSDLTLSSLLNSLAISAASLSRVQGVPSSIFKLRAIGDMGAQGQLVHVLINRGQSASTSVFDPRLLADVTVGEPVSYPNPLWAGRFMARVIRTPEDVGHAIRTLFAILMILQKGDSRDGMISAVYSDNEVEDFSVHDNDIVLTVLVGREPSSEMKARYSAEDRRRDRMAKTLQVPNTAVSRTITNLKTKGYSVSKIDERGDWTTITYLPEGMGY